MKTLVRNISPFIILLVPVAFVLGILFFNTLSPEETEQVKAISSVRVPNLRGIVQLIFSIR